MKKKFTFLIAALMLLTMMVLPWKAVGQASAGTTLWSENFSGYSANNVPSGSITNSHPGTTVYGDVTLTYACTNGASNTQIYNDNLAGGTSPELLVSKKDKSHNGGTFSVSGISTGDATELTLTYKANNSTVTASSNTSGITVGSGTFSSNTYTYTISVSSVSTFNLVFTQTGSSNTRVDNFSLTVKTAGGGGSSGTATTTSINASGITNTDVYVSTVAGSFSATVTPEGGAALVNPSITWSSSNTGVATIESNGTVTLVAAGNTTITASYAGVANEYAASSATYALTVTSSAPDYATLPFNWAGGVKSELTAQMGVSAYGLGSDYAAGNAPYRVKFDDTGDYIEIKTDSKPGVVGIGVKMLGGGTSSKITVIASSDGSSFDAGEELTISGTQDDVVNLTSTRDFSNDVRYIRLVFTKGSNVGVGPISISKEQYNVTCASVSNGSISSDKTKASAGETVTLTAAPSTHYTFSSWSVYKTGDAGTTVTVSDNKFKMPAYAVTVSATFTEMTKHNITIPANVTVNAANNQAYCGDVVTITVTPPSGQYLTSLTVTGSSSVSISPAVSSAVSEYTFTMPDENVTIAASFAGSYTVQFSVNGATNVIEAEDVDAGDEITLPGSEDIPAISGFTFAGWTQSGGVDILDSPYTPNSDVTLYAVYSRTEQEQQPFYVLVESDLGANNWAGDYLIAYSSSVFADGREGGIDGMGAKNKKVSPGANLVGKEIAVTWGDTYNVTLEAITNGYVMKTKDEKYNYQTGNSNGLPSTDNLTTASNYPISVTFTTSSDIKLKNSAGAGFRYNTDGYFRFYSNCGQGAVYLYRRQMVSKNVTKYYTQVLEDNFTATAPMTITTPVVIQSGKVFNMNGNALTNTDAANLIIEDGGQLIVNNSGVKATVKKTVAGYGGSKGDGGWSFIASPIAANVDPTTVTNLINGTPSNYDLYRLNTGTSTPGKEWENYKNSTHTDFELVNGMGYLYANADGVDLAFSGTIQPSNENKNVTGLVANNFNLVGNPYTCDAYLNHSYYTISDADTEGGITSSTVATLASVKIPSCTGVIVKTEAELASVTFTTTKPAKSADNGNVQIALAQNVTTRGESTAQTLDNAIISFNEGSQLGKFYFGTQDANLYIPQDNEEYAIVSSSAQGEMPVNFKAHRDGQYTITVNPQEVEMGYLHLIDNIAGTDVDLLANPSYTFNAKADDYESRFRLVFSANMVNADLNDDFAFFSNGQLVIANEGEAVLQVIDVTGRVVATESVNGTCSKAVNVKTGVYVLRLINGTNVKTQKIIVK